ncbi:MAG: alpha/beta fold hydrolase [Pseudomonadota bacterium]
MRLAETRFGPEGGTPLVIAHGLFGSARNWTAMARRMATDRAVILVDMRNHGESPHADAQDYRSMADDLTETITAAGGPADLLGHSMGGKAAMVVALLQPAVVARLVVADIAPVRYTHTQRPYLEAMRDMDLTGISRRSEADASLAGPVPDRAVRAFLLQNLVTSGGGVSWRLNLAALDRSLDGLMAFPEIDATFTGPATFLSGAQSDYVSPEHHARILSLFPAARFEQVPDAGHWLHADAPDAFEAALRSALPV